MFILLLYASTSICVALYSRSKKEREREKADSTSRAAGTRWTDGVHPFRDHVLGLGWSGRTESRSRWKESLQSTPEQRTQTPVGRRGKVGRFLGGWVLHCFASLPFLQSHLYLFFCLFTGQVHDCTPWLVRLVRSIYLFIYLFGKVARLNTKIDSIINLTRSLFLLFQPYMNCFDGNSVIFMLDTYLSLFLTLKKRYS